MSEVAANNIFFVKRSELEGRWESEYYHPDIKNKEDKVRTKSVKTVKDFIIKIGSGATPSVQESEKYYSDKENGIPFLRVQNLQTDGSLSLHDVKYINKTTHNTSLKRSQVSEGDLLIKITGVGRMAIASVAPKGFEGNTNQHMVVIKTKSVEISRYLANYLNLDLAEKLASRRSTGGTRPALDYKALKSIPVIENIDFSILEEAFKAKIAKEKEAKDLLSSINEYLLKELEIEIPELDYSLEDRIFSSSYSEISGKRFDAFAIFNKDYRIEGGKYENKKLKQLAHLKKGQSITSQNVIDGEYPVIAGGQSSPYNHNVFNHEGNIITVSASGAYSGYVWYHDYPIFASDCTVVYSKNEEEVSTIYIAEIMKCKQKEIYNLQQGAGQPHVYASDFGEINIPIPKPDKQQEIVNHIQAIRQKAAQLEEEAKNILDQTKLEIEKQILEE